MPLDQRCQELLLADDQDHCESALHSAIHEGQTDTSITRILYISKSRQESSSSESLSGRENYESINPLAPQLAIGSSEQVVHHQSGLLDGGPITRSNPAESSISCNDPIAELLTDNDLLDFLLSNSWEEGEVQSMYESLSPLRQQFY